MRHQPGLHAPPAPFPAEPGSEGVPKRCPTCGQSFGASLTHCPNDGAALEAPPADPFLGTVLAGCYRVTKMMAAGGMGRVYEAVHVRLDRKVVVKVLLESHAFNTEVLERAEREAQAISRIQSEHVVQVIDVLRSADGRPCVVVDYLHGEDLGAKLERLGKLPVHEAVEVARQVCAGVTAAHAVGVVHRDLKPSNVYLVARPEGTVAKILDFGVAKLEGSRNLTETGALVGTPAYMAPEQAMGADKADARADVYAVGAVLYHMLTGSPPYGEDDATATLMRLLKGEPPRARSIEPSIPDELEAVLERAMARTPEQRTPSAARLAEDLLPFASVMPFGSPTGTDRTPGSTPARRLGVRWTRPLAVVLTVAAALVTAAWAASFAAVVLLAAIAPASPTELQRALVAVVSAVLGFAVLCFGARAVVLRWRSLPKVEGYVRSLWRATVSALGIAALAELVLLTYRAFTFASAPVAHEEHAAALGLGAIVGVVVFAWNRSRG